MSELTVTVLRDKLENELTIAREKVAILEDRLLWMNGIISESSLKGTATTCGPGADENNQTELLAPAATPDQSTPGAVLRRLMENAPGNFNVTGIAKAALKELPGTAYSELSKKASQVAYRLVKTKKIQLVEQGIGRKPNVYKSISLCG